MLRAFTSRADPELDMISFLHKIILSPEGSAQVAYTLVSCTFCRLKTSEPDTDISSGPEPCLSFSVLG